MGIVRVLIFASLVAGTLGFFWPKFSQESEEIRPWDLADQMEEAARLEKLCQGAVHKRRRQGLGGEGSAN